MLAELLATDGVEEVCELRSRVGIMAFHGGSLEVMTDVIAEATAERAGASLYAIRQPWGFRWHIPSEAIDPADSEEMLAFVEHVEVAVAIHGWGTDGFTPDPPDRRPHRTDPPDRRPHPFRFGSDGRDRPLLLGGRNRAAASHIARTLRDALPGYQIVDDIDRIPKRVRGLSPRNPVNRPRRAGVQLELTPRVRGLPPFWGAEQRGRKCPDTQVLVAALAEAVGTLP